MNVQIDVDGVLADFIKAFYDEARNYIPELPMQTSYDQENWHNWEGIDDKTQSRIWRTIQESKVWWYEVDPLASPEERQSLSQLDYVDGLNLYFVTSRPGNYAKFLTERWIRTYIHIEHPTVIICNRKAAMAKLLNIDLAIEDNGPNAEEIGKVIKGSWHNSYLINRKYNQKYPYLATRVDNLGQFLKVIYDRAKV